MKRIFILFILSALSMISFAQNDNGKLWVSAQGGLMFSNVYSYRGFNYNREYEDLIFKNLIILLAFYLFYKITNSTNKTTTIYSLIFATISTYSLTLGHNTNAFNRIFNIFI